MVLISERVIGTLPVDLAMMLLFCDTYLASYPWFVFGLFCVGERACASGSSIQTGAGATYPFDSLTAINSIFTAMALQASHAVLLR